MNIIKFFEVNNLICLEILFSLINEDSKYLKKKSVHLFCLSKI